MQLFAAAALAGLEDDGASLDRRIGELESAAVQKFPAAVLPVEEAAPYAGPKTPMMASEEN